MPVRLLYLLAMIFSVLPVVLLFLSAVAWVIFSVLPVVLLFLAAVAGVIFPVLPVVLVFLAAVAWVIFFVLPVVLVFLAAVAGVIFPVLPVVLVFLAVVAWVIFFVLPVVLLFLAAVAWVIFSVLPVVFVAAVAWVIFSALLLPAALQQMDLYFTPMCHLLPQSSITWNWILRIVFCPMPCSSATLSVPRVVRMRSVLHLENIVCVSTLKHPPSCAHMNNQHTHHHIIDYPNELDNAVFHQSS